MLDVRANVVVQKVDSSKLSVFYLDMVNKPQESLYFFSEEFSAFVTL